MGDMCTDLPKSLVHMQGVPMLDILLTVLHRTGVERVVLLAEHLAGDIVRFVRSRPVGPMALDVVDSTGTRGGSHVLAAMSLVAPPFLVVAGNVFFEEMAVLDLLAAASEWPDLPAVVSSRRHRARGHLGVVPDSTGRWVMQALRDVDRTDDDWEMIDLYLLTAAVTEEMSRHEISHSRALERRAASHGRILHVPYRGAWAHIERPHDLADPEALALADQLLSCR